MDIEQYFEDAVVQNDLNREDQSSLNKWKSSSEAVADADNCSAGGFDCNICLDTVQDPVVTLCGHLFCWPCIYKWLHVQSISTEDQDQEQQQCPVCKAEVSASALVPLYGRGRTLRPSNVKSHHLGITIPKRPIGPCGTDSPRSSISPRLTPPLNYRNHPHQSHLYYSQPGYSGSPMLSSGSITRTLFDPMIGMFGEMVHGRMFGNSITNIYAYPNSYHLAGNTSPRIRRQLMQADKSLNRICFFLFCCAVLCLLLF